MKSWFQSFFNSLFKPHSIVLFTVGLSALAWFAPSIGNYERGFSIAEPVTIVNLISILTWYSLIIFPTYFFFKLGQTLQSFGYFDDHINIDSNLTYYLYSIIGFLGFVVGLKQILSGGLSSLLVSLFIDFQGNVVQESLDENYSIGLISLRYILIITFGIALYRVQSKKEYNFVNIFNIVIFLTYILLFSKRQQILTAFFVYFTISNRNKDLLKKISTKAIYISIVLVFSLITVASTVRNFKTYESRGQNNAIDATLANALEYLASPFQAQLEIGNNSYQATHGVYYTYFTHIDESLNTNSAMTDIIYYHGWLAFLLVLFLSSGMALIAGVLYKNKNNYLFVGYPIFLYGFAELWRLNYFATGIFFTLTIISIGVPVSLAFVRKTLTTP